ncbi:glycoside hydrolase TIM-barrel-like domain-containing protein [Acuticoccus sp. MNP-M23]|uniref:baseplate multidomain protein megatron n=1 Tax=Acuticoccus sp. MNP-M23 TaxID=3072793 RepID=UPI0028150596|nr:glycoside hydrolase TIM-barrel-like domain-containing protein [Acuticoccus sp. MNP-M23]WMS41703.1 glycoside hydrolase TIM-barrel-like domain-containing protein [Acuticoccus sp. MNP-M23]
MATLVLQAAGQAVGGMFGPVGAFVGQAAGALAGNYIDQRLLGDNDTRSVGQLDDLSVQTATEGNPLPRIYGRMRVAGTLIWATDFVEHSATQSSGKGGGPSVREYSYTVSFAVALCEGPIARIGRVWADGDELDLTQVAMEVHTGRPDQDPDDVIAGIEDEAPAYRNTAYVVFAHLPVGPFGNRIPQLTFEVVRPIGALESTVRAVTIIPGATEFGYEPGEVKRVLAPGERTADNRHVGTAVSDFEASLDELQALCPNLERVALVVSWFGDDLRASDCTIQPCVEATERDTDTPWAVAGETRATAKLVSLDSEGRPSYGGTPSDSAVLNAIAALKARGLKVVFYPFILMDVPAGNGLADPYGGAEQATHPWRGRITVSPAPGETGSPDGTAAATADIAALVGSAAPGDYSTSGGKIVYGGPAEWSLRRMVLHYANLVALAGGVDAFLVGSELRGLTTVRGASGYPFVDALSALVDDVRGIVGGAVRISYAADWSEYFGHQPDAGTVSFHLDPLWSNANVDFIGIDNYWPLSDWRTGPHLDEALADTPHDDAYLTGNIVGGEGYDWYYADDAARAAQVRTPITGDWLYRYKDVKGWWSNQHYDRVGGVPVAQPTSWVPQSKPIWFTEVGCPAVSFGANQPNVFYDPKSSESRLPYFSTGRRDDAMQRAYLKAMLGAFDPAVSSDIDLFNPVSGVYAGRMIDPGTVHVWTWDARPWPVFPHRSDVWTDGENWERGHWLTGRLGAAPVADLLAALFADWGVPAPDISAVNTVLDGYLIARPQSLRDAIEDITAATSIVGADTGTGIRFVGLDRPSGALIEVDDLVELSAERPLLTEVRDEAAGLPVEERLRYFDSGRSFQVANARYRPLEASTRQIEVISVSASLNDGLATELAQLALSARWARRTTLRFALPPSAIAMLPGDIVTVRHDGRDRDVIVEEVEDVGHREVTGRTIDRVALAPTPTPGALTPSISFVTKSPPFAVGVNLPLIGDVVRDQRAWIGAYARPWPGNVGVWRLDDDNGFILETTVTRPASMGQVIGGIDDGPTSRWDYGGTLDVLMFNTLLETESRRNVLDGANTLAVRAANGVWEVVQFRRADLIGERTYRLSTLLRGGLGTEDATVAGLPVGAPVVVLDDTLSVLPVLSAHVGQPQTYRVGPLVEGVGGTNTTTFNFTPTGRAITPYAPVHVKARRRTANAAMDISWIRRTRIDGNEWPNRTTVPLGESAEIYLVEILDQGVVVRSAETTKPIYLYSLANQLADFGVAQTVVTVRVTQIAPGFGPGVPTEVTVNVEQP